MELELASARQHDIANMLWVAKNEGEVAAIISYYGHDAIVVREMMVAAAVDEITETDLAVEILRDIIDTK